ncbi:hypothetical protein FB107DRAFT_294669 [Schizophyllum commune]
MTAISEQPNSAVCPEQAAKPDPVYYHSDGDLEVLVGDTLFKVHNILFARLGIDAPATATSAGEQPTKKVDIVVLSSITLDDFRALCWAVYLLPGDPPPGIDDIERMLRIASVSHTFGITNLLTWAGEYLTKKAECIAGLPTLERPGWDPGFLSCLLRVCTTCGLADAVRNFEDIWIARLVDKNLAAFPEALTTADDLRLRRLQGYAYYYLLIAAADNDANRIPHEPLHPCVAAHRRTAYDIPGITHDQRDRLLDGEHSLVLRRPSMLRKIRRVACRLDSSVCDEVDHMDLCMRSYTGCVDRAFVLPGVLAFDMFKLLTEVVTQLRSDTRIPQSCKEAALARLALLRTDIEHEVIDHFTPAVEFRLGRNAG